MPSHAALAKIHIAKKELGLTDESYRDILHLHFLVASAAKLSDRQATVLLNTFKDKGWKEKSGKGVRYKERFQRKVQALWITLHKAGVIKNGSDQAMNKFVKKVTGIDRLAWCLSENDCYPAIEALKDWGKRKGVIFE